jgi:hypothetical protein
MSLRLAAPLRGQHPMPTQPWSAHANLLSVDLVISSAIEESPFPIAETVRCGQGDGFRELFGHPR